jgi:hypothetical protein
MSIFKIISLLSLMLICTSIKAQNKISLRFLSLGGDGFRIMPGCELLYSREIFQGLSLRAGYTQASKKILLNNSFVSNEENLIKENLLIDTNDSDNPTVEHNQYVSYNLGLSKVINSTIKSDITLYLGIRYESLNKLNFISSGSKLEFIKTLSKRNRGISPEIELSYNYRISQSVGIVGAFYYSNQNSIFVGTIGGSIYF